MTTLRSTTTSFEIVKELIHEAKVLNLRKRFNILRWEWEYQFEHIIKP